VEVARDAPALGLLRHQQPAGERLLLAVNLAELGFARVERALNVLAIGDITHYRQELAQPGPDHPHLELAARILTAAAFLDTGRRSLSSSRDGSLDSRGDLGRSYGAQVLANRAIRQEHTGGSSSVLFANKAVGAQNEDGVWQRGEHRLRAARQPTRARLGITASSVAEDDSGNQRQDAESKNSARHRHCTTVRR